MNKPKHTQGPWIVAKEKTIIRTGELLVASTEPLEAFIGTGLREYNRATREANARLIAAAPEMLEALKVALKHLDIESGGYSIQTQVKRAIAKATGGDE